MQYHFEEAMKYLSAVQVAPEKTAILKDICTRLMYRQS